MQQNGITCLTHTPYYSHGRSAGLSRGNCTSTSFGWDGVGRMSGFAQSLGGTGADGTWGFGYNAANQVRLTTRSNFGSVRGGLIPTLPRPRTRFFRGSGKGPPEILLPRFAAQFTEIRVSAAIPTHA